MRIFKGLKRVFYLGYYVKKMDWPKLHAFINHVHNETGQPRVALISGMFTDSLRHNVSPLEYFLFRFYQLPSQEKAKWAGTGFMYEYQLQMNPIAHRDILEDKLKFHRYFSKFIKRKYMAVSNAGMDEEVLKEILNGSAGKVVVKESRGGSGKGLQVMKTEGLSATWFKENHQRTGNDLVEEYVTQHREVMRLSPSGLNTIRIVTLINSREEVEVLTCRLRISVNSIVDNMAAGNMVARINIETGIVESPGYFSDIRKRPLEKHPITGVSITGFQIPYWDEIIAMAKNAAIAGKANRSVGWDIAVTDHGPDLIEGNHDWCKLVWQLPEEKGLKGELLRHIRS